MSGLKCNPAKAMVNNESARPVRQLYAVFRTSRARTHCCYFQIRVTDSIQGNRLERHQEPDGGFVAECLSHDIFTQADNWELLRNNVQEAVSAYFFDQSNSNG